ncbi:hypothetical protein HG537_0G00490 [Torulaspora globosa]|uniref:Low-affinity Fe(2+) transport protein n=1 Tax=Torulaspora globosa TaxID=48254 RepID=A0A7H9HYY4_9SACH|nr:hypothetical protein HG537_0G00490 [Torulaspora sp. CBS 2947]
MGRIGEFFGNPGCRPDVCQRAPIVVPNFVLESCAGKISHEEQSSVVSTSDESSTEYGTVTVGDNGWIKTSRGFTGLQKDLTDRILDRLVWIAGTEYIFFTMWAILIVWIVLGCVYGGPNVWQVVMQDGQSLQCYFWDTLLMRQQLTSAHEQKVICGIVRSRIAGFKKLARKSRLSQKVDENEVTVTDAAVDMDLSGKLPIENWYDKLANWFSIIIGSLYSMIIFWIGIIIWIACGVIPKPGENQPPYSGETTGSNPRLVKFSSTWQLYINSATAVVLLVSSMFLQNIRARHDKFISKFIVKIFAADREIEERLRIDAGDFQTANPAVKVISSKRTAGQKIIDFYADVVGTGIGVVIAIGAIVAWLSVGKVMNWDDNWWLIIGTYTGLIGFLDGFVIREVYYRIVRDEERNYEIVAQEDLELFDLLGINCPEQFNGKPPNGHKKPLDFKISTWINRLCSSQWSVVFSIIVIVALIIAASALHWTTTGQLLANTPTMIIEAFFMIVLIQAHNWADCQRRVELTALLGRRQIILHHLDRPPTVVSKEE